MSTEFCGPSRQATRTLEAAAALPVIAALLIWATSLANVNVRNMTDVGLVSVLSPWTYVALAILTISFCLDVCLWKAPTWLLLLHTASLVLIIHGTPHLLYGTLRYSWAWKHVGIVDYIQRNGSIDPYIGYLNVYHNWPGFFSLNALIGDVAGVGSAVHYAGWAPVFFSLVDLGALIMIFQAFTHDRRLIWLGAWLFFTANWIGQEYFSPQALTYFLYLVVVGIVLRWFRSTTIPSRDSIKRVLRSARIAGVYHDVVRHVPSLEPEDTPLQPTQRAGLILIVVLLMTTVASAHQLTPLMMISSLALLVLFYVISPRSLPILAAVLAAAWIVFVGEAFLAYNLYWIGESIGSFFTNVRDNFINLADASSGQILVAYIDRGLTALVGLLAAAGFIRRFRAGHWDLPAVLLTLSPVPLLAANSYGGEMVFRVYLFALPFLAFFAATLFYPDQTRGRSVRTAISSTLISIVLLAGLLFGYYGKERQYYFTPDEVQAVDYLDSIAPDSALLVDGSWGWPLKYQNYELYDYLTLAEMSKEDRLQLLDDPVDFISDVMKGYPAAFLLISRSQKALVDMTGILPAGALQDIEQTLVESPRFQVTYENQDARVFALAGQPGEVSR